MEKPVIIFGAKGIAKSALEIFESNEVTVYGFLDQDEKLHGQEIGNAPILGDPEDHGYLKLIGEKCEAFVATDDNSTREEQVEMLTRNRKVMPTNAIHQTANLAKTSSIGHGNFIGAGVILGAESKIGLHCIINTGAILEQDVVIEDFVQVGAGVVLNSGVSIGNNTFIGTGALIVAGIKVGENARIGAGSVVIADVGDNETVFGNPAAKVGK